MSTTSYSRAQLFAYAFLAIPIAFAGLPLYLHAPDFYAREAGLSLAVLGIALLGLRIIDAFQDPLIGALSDKYAALRPALLCTSAIILAASFIALFHPPTNYALAWFMLFVFLATTAYSVLSINLNTLGALWGNAAHIQTRIASWREGLGIIGLLFAVTIPSLPIAQPFLTLSLLLTLLLILGIWLHRRWFAHATLLTTNQSTQSLFFTFRNFNQRTMWFFIAFALSMLASSMPAVLIIFFVRDLLQSEAYLGVFLLLYFIAGMAGMPLWQTLSNRYGKYRSWLWAMILAITSFIGAFFLEAGDVIPYAIICVLSGIAFSADLVLPASILADKLHENAQQDSASSHYSMLAFLTKASLALSSAFTLLLLDVANFAPAEENTATALNALSLLYALIPCLIKLIAASLIWLLANHHSKKIEHAYSSTNRSAPHA